MNKKYYLLSILPAILALAVAFTAQYAFSLYPCKLCIWQRYPYAAVILTTTLALAFSSILSPAAPPASASGRKTSLIYGILTAFNAFLYLISSAIAAYHVAVEYKWIEGASGCSSKTAGADISNDELLAQIMNTPIVMCDNVSFEFLGLSMAGWNLLYGVGAAAFCALILRLSCQRSGDEQQG